MNHLTSDLVQALVTKQDVTGVLYTEQKMSSWLSGPRDFL